MAGTIPELEILGSFGSADAAAEFMSAHDVDLLFLDIQMPGTNGVEFARTIPRTTLVIFTTAFSHYAAEGFEVDAVDYLVKPIQPARFRRAVEKALSYHSLLVSEERNTRGEVENDFIFIRSERRFFKVALSEILFIEGLKDYVIIQTDTRRLITHLNLKTIHEQLPVRTFLRVNRSYIVNCDRIDSFTTNDVFIGDNEIGISELYRDEFLEAVMGK